MALPGKAEDIVYMVQSALGLCARNSALVESDRVSLIGDITDILRNCHRILFISDISQINAIPLSFYWNLCYVGLLFDKILNQLRASSPLVRCFHLYTTESNLTAESFRLETRSTISLGMGFLERVFRLIFPAQNIMILVVERDSGNIKASEISSTALQRILQAGGHYVEQESPGTFPRAEDSQLIALPLPSATSQPPQNSGIFNDAIYHQIAQQRLFQRLEGSLLPQVDFSDADKFPRTAALNQSGLNYTQFRISNEHHFPPQYPEDRGSTEYDFRQGPALIDVSSLSSDTFTIPRMQGVMCSDPLNSVKSSGSISLTKIGSEGLEVGEHAVASTGRRSNATDTMFQFGQDSAGEDDRNDVRSAVHVQEALNTFQNPPTTSKFDHVYPNPGCDVLGVLMRVATRRNPQIDIGPIDSSSVFLICDLTQDNTPIIHASDTFEQLTRYTKSEILGRNCRFLQAPDGQVQSGVGRKYVDDRSIFYLKNQIEQRREAQLSLINYKKGGQPFMNLLTLIPIAWDGNMHKYCVGFLIDLVEHPNCISGKNADGSFVVTYSRTQESKPADDSDAQAGVLQSNGPAALLSMTSPEADSPWSVRDGVPPPYALSPGVFYHTSMMSVMSP